jgi:hypothetical protein
MDFPGTRDYIGAILEQRARYRDQRVLAAQ